MSDNYNIKIGVDSTAAERGVGRFTSSISDALRVLKEFDRKSRSAFEGLNKIANSNVGNLSKSIRGTAQAIETLNRVKISKALVNNLQMLQKTLASFRFNAEAIKRVPEAMAALAKIKIDTRFVGLLNEVKAALKGFRGPPAGADKWRSILASLAKLSVSAALPARITAMAKALSGLRGPSASASKIPQLIRQIAGVRINASLANNLSSLKAAMSGFTGPSAAAIRNLENLLRAMATANPSQIASVAAALQKINGLNVRVAAGASNTGRRSTTAFSAMQRGVVGTTFAMRALDRQMSLTYHATTLLNSALGSLTIGAVVQGIYQTGNAFIALQRTLGAVASSQDEVADHMKFLQDLTSELPISLEAAIESYGKFAVAARLSGASAKQVQQVFKGFSTAFAAMNVGAENQKYAFIALEQIFSKGTVQAEELKQQLGEHLPGTMQILAQSMGKPVTELMKMMQQGQLTSDAMFKMADALSDRFGGAVAAAMNSSSAQVVFLQNAWTNFKNTIFDSGFNAGLGALAKSLRQVLASDDMKRMAQQIGSALGQAMKAIGVFVQMLAQHKDTVLLFVKAFAGYAFITAFAGAVRAATSPVSLLAIGMLALYNLINSNASVPVKLLGAAAAIGVLGAQMGLASAAAIKFAGAIGLAYGAAKGGAALGEWIGEKFGDSMIKNFPNLSKWLADYSQTDFAKTVGDAFGTAGADAGTKAGEKTGSGIADGISSILNPSAIFGGLTKEFNDMMADANKSFDAIQNANLQNQGLIDKNAREEEKRLRDKKAALTTAEQKVLDEVDAVGKANKKYQEQLALIDEIAKKRGLTKEQADGMKAALTAKKLDDINPIGAKVRDYRQELAESTALTGAEKAINKAIEDRQELLKQNIVLTDQQAEALKEYQLGIAKMNGEIGNGIERWTAQVSDWNDSIQTAISDGIDGLSDELTNFVTGANADFASLARSILASFVKAGINSLLKDAFTAMGMNGKENGKSQAESALEKLSALGENITTTMTNVYTSGIAINGNPIGTGSIAASPELAGNREAQRRIDEGAYPAAATNGVTRAPLANIPGTSVAATGPLTTDRLPVEKALADNTAALKAASDQGGLSPARPGSMLDQMRRGTLTADQAIAAKNVVIQSSPSNQRVNDNITFTPDAFDYKQKLINEEAARAQAAAANPFAQTPGIAPIPVAKPAGYAATPGEANPWAALMGPNGGAPQNAPAASGAGGFLSKNSQQLLAQVNPELAKVVENAQKYMPAGQTFQVAPSTIRTYEQQLEYVRTGRSTTMRSNHLTGRAVDLNPYQDGKYIGAKLANYQDMQSAMKQSASELGVPMKWGGDWKSFKDGPHFELPRSYKGGAMQQAGLDPTTTGSITALNQKIASIGSTAQTAAPQLDQIKTKMTETGTNAATSSQTLQMANQQKMAGDQQYGMLAAQTGVQVQTAGLSASTAGPQFQQAGTSIQQAGQSAATAGQQAQTAQPGLGSFGQGIGQLLGPLSSVIPGLGQFGGAIMSLLQSLSSSPSGGGGGGGLFGSLFSGLFGGGGSGGLFKEGGYSNSPVTRAAMPLSTWAGAPHYAEGTTNTSGGMPAILHDNEAVIPLSRGRKIPIEMPEDSRPMYGAGAGTRGGRTPMIFNFNGVKDADTFRASKAQIASTLSSAQRRAEMRNQ